jgi:hypothetical protein
MKKCRELRPCLLTTRFFRFYKYRFEFPKKKNVCFNRFKITSLPQHGLVILIIIVSVLKVHGGLVRTVRQTRVIIRTFIYNLSRTK